MKKALLPLCVGRTSVRHVGLKPDLPLFSWLLLAVISIAPASHADNTVATATAGQWQPRQTAYALVSARQQTALSLPFAVRITSLPVEPGAQVQSGQTLAMFDAPQLRRHLAEWQLARQEQMLAQQQLKVLRRNRQEKTITRRELLTGEQAAAKANAHAELAWQTLAADLDLLNLNLDAQALAKQIDESGLKAVARHLGRLKAPFAGVVTARSAAKGEQLASGAPIIELEAIDRVYLDVGVPESALPDWQKGQTWWPAPAAKTSLTRLGGIQRLDPNSGLWLLRYTAQNPGYRLRDGAWVEVRHLGDPLPVAWVPKQAVASRNGKDWVIVSSKTGPKPVQVVVGPVTANGRIPVIEGIAPGTQVVTEGAYELLYRDLKDLIKFVD